MRGRIKKEFGLARSGDAVIRSQSVEQTCLGPS